jgi:hypothetical protein
LVVAERGINDCGCPIVGKNRAPGVAAIVRTHAVRDGIVEESAVVNGKVAAVVEDSAAQCSATTAALSVAIATKWSSGSGSGPKAADTKAAATAKATATAVSKATVAITAAAAAAEATAATVCSAATAAATVSAISTIPTGA